MDAFAPGLCPKSAILRHELALMAESPDRLLVRTRNPSVLAVSAEAVAQFLPPPESMHPHHPWSRSSQTVITCPDCSLVDVTGVIDGDTIDTSLGRVRFFGVDTPEHGEACFSEATAATKRLTGSQVRLEDGPRLTDNFGRRLAYVYDASGNNIDVQLVAGGFARAWTQDGQQRDLLVGLERRARENGAGCLWE